MKRKIAILLVVALILSFIPAIVAHAADTTVVYQKITTMDELTTGKYVMVVSNGKAPTTLSGSWVLADTPTVTDGQITETNAAGFVWDIVVSGTTVTLTDSNGVTIKPKSGNNNGILSGTYNWNVVCTNGTFQFKGTGTDTTTFALNGTSGFRAYKNTTASGYPNAFTLYKMTEVASEEPTDPTIPTTEPTTPETEPTIPATEPTTPATEPTIPATEPTEPVVSGEAEIVFDDEGKRTLFNEDMQVWEDNGITVTNEQGSSTSAVADYVNPVRFYKSSTLTIAYPGMTKIEFTCSTTGYATALQSSIAGSTVDGKVVTIEFEKADSYTFTLSDGQVRMNSLKVYASAATPEEPSQALVGASYSIRLLEPWALRTFVTFATGTATDPTPIQLADIKSYGAYAIIEHKFDNAATATVEDLIADADTKVYTSAAGTIVPGGDDEATTVVFDFTDEIYTHRLGEKVYWVAYYEDAEGQIHYTNIKSTTIVEVAQTVGGMTSVSEEEKAVLSSMQTLKDAVVAFRGEGLGGTEYPAGVDLNNSGISFGEGGAAGTYKFGTSHQIRLIEPWSIRVNVLILDVAADAYVDYNAENVSYGVIFYHDKAGAYTSGMSVSDIIAKGDAQVYSKGNNNTWIADDGVNVIYDKGIYTYELDTNLYCLPYVVVDGQYYYRSSVICWNLLDEMTTFSQDTTLSTEEIAVFNAMLDLHSKTIAYRSK